MYVLIDALNSFYIYKCRLVVIMIKQAIRNTKLMQQQA